MDLRYVQIIFQVVAFLFAISVHESAHAYVAWRCGDPTARMLGRVTLNPIKHIDIWGTIIIPLFAIMAGFPVIDFKATLIDGAYHDVDSSVLAFEIAARAAFREGLQKAQCKLLEPIMKVEVVTPEDYMGDCIGDLNSRRGQIQGMEARGNAQVINAMVPLANMFGYANSLRMMTGGRGAHYMVFDHYSPVSPDPDDDSFRPAVGMRA